MLFVSTKPNVGHFKTDYGTVKYSFLIDYVRKQNKQRNTETTPFQ